MSQKDQYTFVSFNAANDEHISKSVSLMKNIWGDVEFAKEEYFRWQCVENPSGQAQATLVFSGDYLVAQYFTIPSNLSLPSGENISTLLSVNTATDSLHRKRGLFKKSATRTFENAKSEKFLAIYGFPNEASLPGFLSLKFNTLKKLNLYFGVFSPFKILKAMPILFKNWRYPNFLEADSNFDFFDTSFYFESNSKRDGFLRVPRSLDWTKWRYCNHPTRKYLGFKDDSSSIVFRIFELEGLKIAVIFDVFGNPKKSIIKLFKNKLKNEGVCAACGVFSSSMFEVYPSIKVLLPLALKGSLSPKKFHVILMELQEKIGQSRHLFTLGDLDLY